MMAEFPCLSVLLMCTSMVWFCNCHDSTVSVMDRLDQLETELLDNKMDSLRMEKRLLNIIDDAKTALRAELKENIRDQVKQTMAEILQGDSLQDIVKSEVVSELRHVKHGYHQMKRQLHHVSRSLKDLQVKTIVFHESVLEKARVCNETDQFKISQPKSSLVPESSPVTVNTTSTPRSPALTTPVTRPRPSALTTSVTTPKPSALTTSVTTPRPSALTTSVTTPRPSALTTAVTTPRPNEEKIRILIAPLWSRYKHQFRQLNIHNNSLSVYPYHNVKNVGCVAYIAKTKKLLIGLDNPDMIVSSTLDTNQATVLHRGVEATGMAVDEGQDIVFLSTFRPQYTISRMSTED
ncbi:uncharacterized protein LOC124290310 [Haliotis rubra]|uniref:uncharacterized protein LOC124290310 n=1 Tax=Haliotis rubra TaxID=36100 RepID=UPI001EE52C72|nr:uncharacterized protein LOC124290310 [Haliotis rubra]